MSLHELIAGGRIVDIMVVFVVLEVIALIVYWKKTGKGVPTIPLLANVGAGGSLMLALGATLRDASTTAIAAFLVASLVFHTADIALRWRR